MKIKKLLLVVIMITATPVMFGQPFIQWQKSLGGSDDDYAYAVATTSDNAYVVAGYVYSNDGQVHGNHAWQDMWVVKLNLSGDTLWEKCLGGTLYEQAHAMLQTSDLGYVVAGFSNSNDGQVTGNHGFNDFWIVKLDQTGNIQWEKSLGGSNDDEAYSIYQTLDNGYVIAGSTYSNDGDVTGNHGATDFWVVKLTSTGTLQWQKCLGGTLDEAAASVRQTSDTGYIVAGTSPSVDGQVTGNHGNEDYWVVKLDKNGNIQWEKSLGGSGEDYGTAVLQLADNTYVVAGFAASGNGQVSFNHGLSDYWIVNLDASGNIIWEHSFGGSSEDFAYDIRKTGDGRFIVAGSTRSSDGDVTFNYGQEDYWIIKIDGNGNLVWQKSYGGSASDNAMAIAFTQDEGAIVAGYSTSDDGDVTGNHGSNDYWVVKLSNVTGVNEITRSKNWKVYPNPVSDNFIIESSTPVSEIRMTNPLGEAIPFISKNIAGNTVINTNNLSNGVYLLSFTADGKRCSDKVMISH